MMAIWNLCVRRQRDSEIHVARTEGEGHSLCAVLVGLLKK